MYIYRVLASTGEVAVLHFVAFLVVLWKTKWRPIPFNQAVGQHLYMELGCPNLTHRSLLWVGSRT